MFNKMALVNILLATMTTVYGAISADQFTAIPDNQGGADHQMASNSYSGFLQVGEGKKLHYVFVESEYQPANDPVVIWFNGGPGCSSMLGFLQENGPWVIEDNSKAIVRNPYPWTAEANMLWIESPAGVGFSYGKNTVDLKHYDMGQSQDAFNAIELFFSGFSEFLPNKLYISGESYAGIYVPYLSWQIYQNNLQQEFRSSLVKYNLAGYLVGNGATNWDFDVSPSFPTTAYQFSLIPTSLYTNYTKSGCKVWFNDFKPMEGPPYCKDLWAEINTLTENLNWYDLYRPKYGGGLLTEEERIGTTVIGGVEHKYKRGYTQSEYTPWLNFKKSEGKPEQVYGTSVSDLLNQANVRAALHITDDIQPWEECNGNKNWTYSYSREASQWIYPILKAAGIRAIFYSGDTDGAVPFSGTRQWIKELNYPITKAWQPWYTTLNVNPEVTGYVVQYEGLDFATVHGVGHMAPQWARKAVQSMFFNWIQDKNWDGLVKPLSS